MGVRPSADCGSLAAGPHKTTAVRVRRVSTAEHYAQLLAEAGAGDAVQVEVDGVVD